MSDALNKRIIIYSVLLGVVCMSVMIWYGMTKELAVMPEVKAQTESRNSRFALDGKFDDVYRAENTDRPLTISLPAGYDTSLLELSEDSAHRCVHIFLRGLEEDYFEKNPLTGSAEAVWDVVCRYEEDGARLSIYLNQVLACQEQAEGGRLTLEFVKMRAKYEKLVVLDAGHGGSDDGLISGTTREKEITLDIVGRLEGLLEENGIHVLCTRLSDENVSDAARLELANQADADLFLSIHCAADEKDEFKSGITTYYNDTFFIPGFGNTDFAFEVEDWLYRETKAKACGLQPGQEKSDLLKFATMPAAYVEVGYLSNESERQLLMQEQYREKIAQGLSEAIINSYELLAD